MENLWVQVARRAKEREAYFSTIRPNPKLRVLAADTLRCANERNEGNHDSRPTRTAELWEGLDD